MSEALGRSGRLLFSIRFQSAMSDTDRALLRSQLLMTTHFHPKHPAVTPPLGFVRLDSDSGLFLVRSFGEWALECRSWGKPPAAAIQRWRLLSTFVAHLLDASVAPTAAGQAADRPSTIGSPSGLTPR